MYGVKTGNFILFPNSPEQGIEIDKIYLKEFASYDPWNLTFNAGVSLKNLGVTVGWTPDILMGALELHAGVFNSWENTFNFKLEPRIGIGATLKIKGGGK